MLGYELVSDITVSTATTQVDFTGLNITKDDDYVLVATQDDGPINSTLSLYVNGNTSASNYYEQVLSANGTSVSGARYNTAWLTLSGGLNAFITNIKLSNNGYVVFTSNSIDEVGSSSMRFFNACCTSIFTVSAITALNIVSDLSNGIYTGSRFQLYKRIAEVVADITVSTATTQVDITGLNIDKTSEYRLVADITPSNSSTGEYLYINGNAINSNYYNQRIKADTTTITASRENAPVLIDNEPTYNSVSYADLKLTSSGFFAYQSKYIRSYNFGSSVVLTDRRGTSTFTTTSITQLTITATTTNGIGVGSRFQLIKFK